MGVYSERLTKLISPHQLASCYGVSNIVHYWENPYGTVQELGERGHGLLLTTGAGLMMSLMDQLPACSYAADLGGGRNVEGMGKFLEAASHLFDHILVVAWFTASNPQAWEENYLDHITNSNVAYWSNEPLNIPTRFQSVNDAIRWSNGFLPAFHPAMREKRLRG